MRTASTGACLHQTHAWPASSKRVQDGGVAGPAPPPGAVLEAGLGLVSPPSSLSSGSSEPSMVAMGATSTLLNLGMGSGFDLSPGFMPPPGFREPFSEARELAEVPESDVVPAEVGEAPLPTTIETWNYESFF